MTGISRKEAISSDALDARWIALAGVRPRESVVADYLLSVDLAASVDFEVKVAGDQQYQLFLDGKFIGRTGETGDPDHWYFDVHRLQLSAGPHVLVARVWSWGGRRSAIAQMEVFHGFYLAPVGRDAAREFATGVAPWRVKRASHISFQEHSISPGLWIGVAPSQVEVLDTASGEWQCDSEWKLPRIGRVKSRTRGLRHGRDHGLTRATLPPPLVRPIQTGRIAFVSTKLAAGDPLRKDDHEPRESVRYGKLLIGKDVAVPTRSAVRLVIDLDEYYCVRPVVRISGGRGARIRFTWAESLFEEATGLRKGDRNAVFGKYFRGIWDEVEIASGDRHVWSPLTWRAGRYLEISVDCPSEPLTIGLELEETRYPFPAGEFFVTQQPMINRLAPIAKRAIEMSSHDHFVDCPFYERIAYSGDGRVEALVGYVVFGDDLLARKAITLFASSARENGLCRSCWPARVVQQIPSFALWWIAMVHDFAMWRRDRKLVRSVLPAIRSTLDFFLTQLNADGLFPHPKRIWNFVDWVPEWDENPRGGVPPGKGGVSGPVNWILVNALGFAADLEDHVGSRELARNYRQAALRACQGLQQHFWSPTRGLYADTRGGRSFSEHSQVMAVLSGLLPRDECIGILQRLRDNESTSRCSLFFTHYLFEADFQLGLGRRFIETMPKWVEFVDEGFKTVPENFTETRSDCHGWGAHPLYHLAANVAGIRPSRFGFQRVTIRPQLHGFDDLRVKCPHPNGEIVAAYRKTKSALISRITLPPGLTGRFIHGGSDVRLTPGTQTITSPLNQLPTL